MPNLPSIRFGQPIGKVDGTGNVVADPTWWRYWTQQQAPAIDFAQTNMLTATYDDAHDHRVLSIRNQNGAELALDELFCFDINYWLTRDEIDDTRNQTGPTINLTTQIQFAVDTLMAKFAGAPYPGAPGASRGLQLRFHHSYLVNGFPVWPSAIGVIGDNMRETIFVQSLTPAGSMFGIDAGNPEASGGRSSYWVGEHFSIIGKSNRVNPSGGACRGIEFLAPTGSNAAYNAGLLTWVNVTGMSGSGIYVPLKRHAPKLRFCYVNGSGGLDTSVAKDGSGFEPNIYIGSDSDAELLHCGSGSGKGHSVQIHTCETAQVKGGDYWASNNAALGYRAFYLDNFDYGLFEGFDCNGAIEYQGSGASKSAQVRFVNINFRFRSSSFGDDDPDDPGVQPAPLDGYIILKNSVGSLSQGCTFTPYYDKTGVVAARPAYVYSTTGQTAHLALDRLQDIGSNDWPAGQNLLVTPTEATTITNDRTKCYVAAASLSATYKSGLLADYIRFTGDVDSGIVGRQDNRNVAAGLLGEFSGANVNSGSAVVLVTNTATDIVTLTLTSGEWDVWAGFQFSSGAAATPTLTKACLSLTSATITSTASRDYGGKALSLTGVTADFDSYRIGPKRIKIPFGSTQTMYAVARCTFTPAGAVGCYADIEARRVA